MTGNPFEAPASDSRAVAKSESQFDQLRAILRSWEGLRVYYNAWLIGVVLFAAAALLLSGRLPVLLGPLAVAGAIVANICFFAGPFAEAYLFILGWNHTVVRGILFVSGTMFATGLALAAIAAATFDWLPNQD